VQIGRRSQFRDTAIVQARRSIGGGEDHGSFSQLTEFAAAIAGFSGITIAIQSREKKPDAIRSFRNKNLITWSLCAAFGSTLPQSVFHLGARGGEIWVRSSLVYALLLAVVLLIPLSERRHLSLEQRARLSPVVWVVGLGGTALVLACQLANSAGWFGEPTAGPLYLGVLWMILFGAHQFYRNLFGPSSPD